MSINVKQEPEKPKDTQYTIVDGDTLTSIAQAQNTTVQRLFDANPSISNPDEITPSEVLIIPLNSDVLTERAMPVNIAMNSTETVLLGTAVTGGSSNTYTAGQCTAFVKDTLSWVQNGWGNANQWISLSGHSVSSIPIVGSVASARTYSHVAVVIGVGEGTVTVREQNYDEPFIIDTRVAPISEFQYIYP